MSRSSDASFVAHRAHDFYSRPGQQWTAESIRKVDDGNPPLRFWPRISFGGSLPHDVFSDCTRPADDVVRPVLPGCPQPWRPETICLSVTEERWASWPACSGKSPGENVAPLVMLNRPRRKGGYGEGRTFGHKIGRVDHRRTWFSLFSAHTGRPRRTTAAIWGRRTVMEQR